MPRSLIINRDLVRALREKRSLSQERAAFMAGVTAFTLRKIEKGQQKDLSVSTLGGIADALSVKPAELLTWVDEPLEERT